MKTKTLLFFIVSQFFVFNIYSLTFFVAADPHYGYEAWDSNELQNKAGIDDMNTLPGTPFPRETDGVVQEPEGVLVCGDLTGGGSILNWTGYWAWGWVDGFITDYEVNGKGRLIYPVYEGFGNHDVLGDHGSMKDGLVVRTGIKRRNMLRSTPINKSDNSLHYSFDWEGVHFVNLNLYPGSDGHARNSLEFLEEDLAEHIGNSNRPIILYHHYDLWASDRWWTEEEKEAYYDVIQGYNVIAIFVGHSHRSKNYLWKGFQVFNAPAVKTRGTYFVVRVNLEKERIYVWEREPGEWGRRWSKPFPIKN